MNPGEEGLEGERGRGGKGPSVATSTLFSSYAYARWING